MDFFTKNKFVILTAGVWLFALLIVGMLSSTLPAHAHGAKECGSKAYPSYYRWDSSWYTQIAQKGYDFSTVKNSSVAYWPLYPFTIKLLHYTRIVDIGYTSTVLSVLYALISVFLLFRLVRMDYDERTSKSILLVFLLFPSTYFLITGYPESLFVLMTLSSFYFARKNRWMLAGIFGALLALTKPYGFLIIATLLWEYMVSQNWDYKVFFKKINWLPLFLPMVSVVGYMLFNYLKFGTALAFLEAEKTWGRSLSNPIMALLLEAKSYITPPGKLLTGEGFPYIIYFFSFFFFLWAMKISWKKVRTSYLLFTALSMFTALATGTLTSWDRYMMISVASLIGVGVFFSTQKKYVFISYLIASGALLLFLASLFVRCYPVE